MANKVQCVIAGAGIVGLACARTLARAGVEVIVIERNKIPMNETSSRNSEVIHAGLYYPKGSLKAKLCVEGRGMLYDLLKEYSIPHSNCGKLLVATSADEHSKLLRIQAHAIGNGVGDIKLLTGEDVRKDFEPSVRCHSALWSGSTGILDSHRYADYLIADAEEHGAMFIYNCAVDSVQHDVSTGVATLATSQGPIECNMFVNSTGLYAPFIAKKMAAYDPARVPLAYYSKGSYFKVASRHLVSLSHLVYPLPSAGGLGVHATIDLAGAVKFGPDSEWLKEGISTVNESGMESFVHHLAPPEGRKAFEVKDSQVGKFEAEICKYLPHLLSEKDWLIPDYSGIRPKLVGPSGDPHASVSAIDRFNRDLSDFVIEGPKDHGLPGTVNLFGIESPGLTSSLAIAKHVSELLLK